MRHNRISLLLFFILLPIMGLLAYLEKEDLTIKDFFFPEVPYMRIGDLPVRIELAVSAAERQQGLSNRTSLDTDGLLFIFPENGYHGIWMKDMRFPIDIIWISEQHTIVHIEQNVDPSTYPRIFRPSVPARYVLETNAHYVDTFNLTTGQTVTMPPHVLELVSL